MIMRALQHAMSDPKGPVYVCAAREVLEEDIEPYHLDMSVWDPIKLGSLPDEAVDEITHALVGAQNPLIVTGYSGRNHNAVRELVKLADNLPIRVLDTSGSDMCFPANHRGGCNAGCPFEPGTNLVSRLDWISIWKPSVGNESGCYYCPGL